MKAESSSAPSSDGADNTSSAPDGDNYAFNLSRPADAATKESDGSSSAKEPGKEPATAPIPESTSSSSQVTAEVVEKVGDSSLAESKEPEVPEAVRMLVSQGVAESKGRF